MRVHTFTPLDSSKNQIIKRIKYKIYDYGDMCIIAFSSTQVECYRFVDRRQEGDSFVEILEKQPIGYMPSGEAVCSIVDIGITKEPNTFVYGNVLLKVSEQTFMKPLVQESTNVFEKMSTPRNPTHTKQFKRKPLVLNGPVQTSIPLIMPQPIQNEDNGPKKIRTRVPMMSIPLTMPLTAGME